MAGGTMRWSVERKTVGTGADAAAATGRWVAPYAACGTFWGINSLLTAGAVAAPTPCMPSCNAVAATAFELQRFVDHPINRLHAIPSSNMKASIRIGAYSLWM